MVGALFGTGHRMSSAEALKKAEEALEFVDLTALKNVPAGDLTLADQKRLEVARALASDPELLLLDELMAGLTADRGGGGHGRRGRRSGRAASPSS